MSPDYLAAALNPSSVAIVGASDNPNKVGGRPLLYLSRFGFKGRIYPINPTRDSVQGFRSYPDLASLPEAPDLAIIATPGELVRSALDECANAGVRVTIVMSSGYGETADPLAISAERAMVARARSAGMRLVGPNSQGLANFGTGVVASFSTMFLEVPPMDGPVAIISQSGMMSTVPYGLLRGKGLGVRHSHATGNESDVTLPELAIAVLQDPAVKLLLLYIESVRNADLLAEAAVVARRRGVPIVAVKTGRTVRGQQAARSHTGALANDDRTVDAFFTRHGIWRVNDIHELVSASELYLKGWRPTHRKLVVVSNSGASCVMAADSAQQLGIELATLSNATVATLAALLPPFATATNPIDITAALLTDSRLFGRILSVLAQDSEADLYLVAIPVAGAGYDVPMFVRDTADFMARTGKAVVVAAPQESVAAQFRAAGVPSFANQTEAIAALAQIARHTELMQQSNATPGERTAIAVPGGAAQFLDEAESLAWLHAHGMPTVAHRLCRSVADAQDAQREFGGPVVIKGCAHAVPHKSEHGLVTLNVCGAHEIAAAYVRLRETLDQLGVEGQILVAPMIAGRMEVLLGAKIDPLFGPVVIVGDGGKYVEVYGDVQLLIPPVTFEHVRDAVMRLRIAPFFEGVRGEPELDLEALCVAAVRLSEIMASSGDQITSIDLNPVMVGVKGEGVTIVDALVERNLRPLVAR
jgi:acyl-CoA synthetase (NDP forming)